MNEINKGILRGNYTLPVFLDVAGAFDHLSFEAAKKAIEAEGINPRITKWYRQYLKNRISRRELQGHIKEISIKTGTPQGGILSVLLWNI